MTALLVPVLRRTWASGSEGCRNRAEQKMESADKMKCGAPHDVEAFNAVPVSGSQEGLGRAEALSMMTGEASKAREYSFLDPESRRAKLAEGQLIDVSAQAKLVGFAVPVAISRDAWEMLVDIQSSSTPAEHNPRRRERYLLQILHEAVQVARRAEDSESLFLVYRPTDVFERNRTRKIGNQHSLLIQCGPGDLDEPVVTISVGAGASEASGAAIT